MPHDLDQSIDRCRTDSVKWSAYPADTLPLWVADMDFAAPPVVLEALQRRLEHGVLGYGCEPPELREVFRARLKALYDWEVPKDWLVPLPGVVIGFNLLCHALTTAGDGVLVQTPAYPPILAAPANCSCYRDEAPLSQRPDGSYGFDPAEFEAAIRPRTRVFIFCNPHNPVGRVYTRGELETLAEICLRHRVTLCSDEIHADFIYRGYRHVPIASLSREVGEHTVTLMAPSKTYNIPGLHCAMGIVPDEELRSRLEKARVGLVAEPDILGYVATVAAYRDAQPWLDDVLAYLEDNRDYVAEFVRQRLPGISMVKPEGGYLAWLDCRRLKLPEAPFDFFLHQARVALMPGPAYGLGGEGFLRLNFGCTRATLTAALERMERALAGVAQ
ncbi:MAG TPA: PatB family C-S lyase [Anaerolineae bacterium]|nr:PatB family C-S lyase [Anaerolineae bacterium]HQJ51190.1 PatB family C-S lyase [Anaerolineae bacterium]